MNKEEVGSSEPTVNFFQVAWCYVSKDKIVNLILITRLTTSIYSNFLYNCAVNWHFAKYVGQ